MFFKYKFFHEFVTRLITLYHLLVYNSGDQLLTREPHVALVIVRCDLRLIYKIKIYLLY